MMRTIYLVLLTVVMTGVAVGEDEPFKLNENLSDEFDELVEKLADALGHTNKEPIAYYRRTVADELVSRMIPDVEFINRVNENVFNMQLIPQPDNPRQLVLVTGWLNAEHPELDAKIRNRIESRLVQNLNQIILSMIHTGQPMPDYLKVFFGRLAAAAADGTYSKKVKNGELFQHFPFELLQRP